MTSKKAEFLARFPSLAEAIKFEDSVLSSGREFLPQCALDVLDGAEGSGEYWQFLIEQDRAWATEAE